MLKNILRGKDCKGAWERAENAVDFVREGSPEVAVSAPPSLLVRYVLVWISVLSCLEHGVVDLNLQPPQDVIPNDWLGPLKPSNDKRR